MRHLRIAVRTKPITTRTKPTGSVKSMYQMYPPVPLPSSHIETPWMMDVTNARANGERAKINPTRANGNGFKIHKPKGLLASRESTAVWAIG